ncbi:MAG: beta-hydroxylase, aspartyl/asparaginyl family protein [Deltaproteobacteria bacterium]|nr:beta-hydroxylase, aspartyl/asparaginyl family protein [Deltaproteobacteria bacterium]
MAPLATKGDSSTTARSISSSLQILDEKLAAVWFPEAEVPTYQLVVTAPVGGGGGTWTWHPTEGMTEGATRPPTCRLVLDHEALANLVDGTVTCDDLVDRRALQMSGYYTDWSAFLSAFLDDKGRQLVTIDRARHPSTRAKALALQRADAMFKELTNDDAALARLRRMLVMWRDHDLDELLPDHSQLIPFPDAKLTPWSEYAVSQEISSLVAENLPALQAEARQFATGEVHAPTYGHRADGDSEPLFYNAPKGWRSYWLLSLYRKRPEAVFAKLPVTSRIVDELSSRHSMVHMAYLLMEPGSQLRSHTDGGSLFYQSYCPIIAPAGSYVEILGERIPLQAGKTLAFSDAFVHSAGNNGSSLRVVLSIIYPNPQLTALEQTCLRRLQDILPKGTLIYSGEYD